MDLSEIEGLDDSVKEQILALHNADVTGLKAKNDELISEQRAAKEAADEAARAAKLAKDEAELTKAKKAGDLESLEATLTAQHNAQLEALKADLSKRDELILGGKREAAINDLANGFASTDAAKLLLKQMVDVELTESGEVATTYKGLDGAVISTDAKVFNEWMKGQDALKPFLKGVDSGGGGATGGSGSGGGATGIEYSKMTPAQKADYLKNKR